MRGVEFEADRLVLMPAQGQHQTAVEALHDLLDYLGLARVFDDYRAVPEAEIRRRLLPLTIIERILAAKPSGLLASIMGAAQGLARVLKRRNP